MHITLVPIKNYDFNLYITYKEEIFDGVGWQETGQVHEVEELTFQVIG